MPFSTKIAPLMYFSWQHEEPLNIKDQNINTQFKIEHYLFDHNISMILLQLSRMCKRAG